MAAAAGRFTRRDRIRRPAEFKGIQRGGRRSAGAAFVVLASRVRPDPQRQSGVRSRLGITVSRKVGKAVQRNRVKRRVREWFRQQRASLSEPTDLVVIARPPAAGLSGAQVASALSRQLHELGILRPGGRSGD